MKYTILNTIVAVTGLTLLIQGCSPAGGDYPGTEYMPDMAHAISYEANVYSDYTLNKWKVESVKDAKELANPKLPVKGTMPRGYAAYSGDGGYRSGELAASMAGKHSIQGMHINPNGHVPYYYADTEEDRQRAISEITKAPFPITKEGLEKGKELYNIYCGICHGVKADGQGYLAREGGKYGAIAQPISLISPELIASSNGRYYHAIMYGKNSMGNYADKLSYEERWRVIQHIRSIQAGTAKLEYNEKKNTLNSDMPFAAIPVTVPVVKEEAPAVAPAETNHGGGH